MKVCVGEKCNAHLFNFTPETHKSFQYINHDSWIRNLCVRVIDGKGERVLRERFRIFPGFLVEKVLMFHQIVWQPKKRKSTEQGKLYDFIMKLPFIPTPCVFVHFVLCFSSIFSQSSVKSIRNRPFVLQIDTHRRLSAHNVRTIKTIIWMQSNVA